MVGLRLTQPQAQALLDVSHHYEDVMGVSRHIVVWTSPRQIRRKYRYIVQESEQLERVARTIQGETVAGREEFEITLEQALAFWGRILSSLDSRRSRRRLAAQDVSVREELSQMFGRIVRGLWDTTEPLVREAINRRRRRESGWMIAIMEEDSAGQDVVH